MTGYKIAISIDRERGPFISMVELETLEDSIIITPNDKIPVYINLAEQLVITPLYGSDVDKERGIRKYRTDRAVVRDINPVYPSKSRDWNLKAYSIYQLAEVMEFIRSFGAGKPSENYPFVYAKDKIISSVLDVNVSEPCGMGIHFFETMADAISYLNFDRAFYARMAYNNIYDEWYSHSDSIMNKNINKFLKELAK